VFNDANAGFNIPGLGLNTGVTNPSLYGSPDITINGFDEIGLTPHLGRIDTTGHIDETFTYTAGLTNCGLAANTAGPLSTSSMTATSAAFSTSTGLSGIGEPAVVRSILSPIF